MASRNRPNLRAMLAMQGLRQGSVSPRLQDLVAIDPETSTTGFQCNHGGGLECDSYEGGQYCYCKSCGRSLTGLAGTTACFTYRPSVTPESKPQLGYAANPDPRFGGFWKSRGRGAQQTNCYYDSHGNYCCPGPNGIECTGPSGTFTIPNTPVQARWPGNLQQYGYGMNPQFPGTTGWKAAGPTLAAWPSNLKQYQLR